MTEFVVVNVALFVPLTIAVVAFALSVGMVLMAGYNWSQTGKRKVAR